MSRESNSGGCIRGCISIPFKIIEGLILILLGLGRVLIFGALLLIFLIILFVLFS